MPLPADRRRRRWCHGRRRSARRDGEPTRGARDAQLGVTWDVGGAIEVTSSITLTKTDQVHLHVRFRGGQTTTLKIPKPLNSWQARQTPVDTIALIDRLLDELTDAETADELNQAGHRSGMNQPFTRRIIIHLRLDHNLPSHYQRLRDRGMLTHQEIAQRLRAHPRTIHAWRHAGLLTAHKANDRNTHLYEPPEPGDPRPITRRGWRLWEREPTPSTPGGAL